MDYNVDNIESKPEINPTVNTDIVLHKDGKFQRAKIFGSNGKIKQAFVDSVIEQTIINNDYVLDPEQIVPSEALYNDVPETLAGDVLKRVDFADGVDVNYRETTTWYDGTPMTDAKLDNVIFIKRGSKYYQKQIDKNELLKVDTIADLRNFNGYYEGQEVVLMGYYEAGDKDPLTYKWSLTQGVDDGGIVINSEYGSWNAIFSDSLNAGWFGIKGDGVTDESVKINNLMTTANDIGVRVVEFSKGVFIGSWTIINLNYISGELHVKGAGRLATIFKAPSTTQDCITIDGNNVKLSSIGVRDSKDGIVIGVSRGLSKITLEDIDVGYNSGSGINIKSIISGYFKNMYITYNALDGLRSMPSSIITTLEVHNSQFRHNQNYGVNLQTGKLITFDTCVFEVNYIAGVLLRGLQADQGSSINFRNSWWEKNCLAGSVGVAQLILDGYPDGSSRVTNVTFDNCNIPFGHEVPAILSRRARNIRFKNSNIAYIFVQNHVPTNYPYIKYGAARDVADNNKVYLSLVAGNSAAFTDTASWKLITEDYTGYNITVLNEGVEVTSANFTEDMRIIDYMNPLEDDYLIEKKGFSVEYTINNVIYRSKNLYTTDVQISQATIVAANVRPPVNRPEAFRALASTASYNITLPLAGSVLSGKTIDVTRAGTTGFVIGVVPQGSDTIGTPVTLNKNLDTVRLISNGVNKWDVLEYIKQSTTSESGLVSLATQNEVDEGLNNTKAVTPLTLETKMKQGVVSSINTIDAVDEATAIALTNENKAKINEMIAKLGNVIFK